MLMIKRLGTYFLGSILLKAAAFMTIPVMMRLLTPEEIGLFSLVNSFIAIVSTLMSCGLRQVLSIEYFHCTSDVQQGELLNDLLMLYLICALPLLLIGIVFCDFFNIVIFAHQAPLSLIVISLIYSFFLFFTEFFYQLLIYTHRARALITIQLCAALCMGIGGIGTLLWLDWGIEGVICAQLLGVTIVCGIGLYEYRQKDTTYSWNMQRFKERGLSYLAQGLPFVPSVLAAWILSSTNRWLLMAKYGLHEVGIYAVAEIAVTLFNVAVLYPLGAAYVPSLLKKYAQERQNIIMLETWNKKVMWYAMGGIAVSAIIGYWFFITFLYNWIPAVYKETLSYMLILILGQVFLMGTYFSSCYIQFMKKTLFINGAFVFCAGINAILASLFLRWYGVGGATGALAVSYCIYFVLILWYNNWLKKQVEVTHGVYTVE